MSVDVVKFLKEIESAASTVLGVASETPVETPAKSLAKKIREVIEAVEADFGVGEAEPEPPTPVKVAAEPATPAAE